MNSFEGVEIFICVVEAGSFTAAAAQLGLAKSSVSETVRRLETRLNVRLLDRSTRRVATTEAGRAFYEHSRLAVEQARRARAAARSLGVEPAGRLRVATPESFDRLIVPALPVFFEEFPGSAVDFVAGVEQIDLIREGIDVAIRIAPQLSGSWIARRLGISRVVIAAAPAYLARAGAPTRPEQVAQHRCIGYSPLFWGREWRFETKAGVLAVPINAAMTSNNTESLRGAALAGLGLVALPGWLVASELASGALVRVLADYETPPSEICAVYPSNRLIAPKIRGFVDAVAAQLRRLPP